MMKEINHEIPCLTSVPLRQNKTTAQRLKDAVIGQIYATTKLRRQLQNRNRKYDGFVKRGSFCNSELSIDCFGSTYPLKTHFVFAS